MPVHTPRRRCHAACRRRYAMLLLLAADADAMLADMPLRLLLLFARALSLRFAMIFSAMPYATAY